MIGNLSRMLLVLVIAALSGQLDPAEAQDDIQGFIYGRVTTESGNEYVGFIRWGDEEAFWDDLFHSSKEDLDWADYIDDDDRDRDRDNDHEIKIFDWSVRVKGHKWSGGRMYIARFGDITKIEPRGDDGAIVTMKDGTEFDVEGASNDVGGKVVVDDQSLGRIEVHWKRIESIEFEQAPRGAKPSAHRLHATVQTDEGEFTGYIQWDKQECLSTDRLDGDTEDGDISLEMGNIASIERRGRRSSQVTLRDGRELRLRGSNDVNHENRGIMVEDPRFGRVTIMWDAFDRIDFSEPGASGRAYRDFPPLGRIRGTVTTRDGETFAGALVIDLDEAYGWEIINGSDRDIEYDIPLVLIKEIHRVDDDESRIVFRSGESVHLYDGQDVTDSNAGVIIFQQDDDRDAKYVPWDDIDNVVFD